MNDGDLAGRLPYFVEALRLDAATRRGSSDHRLRLGMLCWGSAPSPRVWFHNHPIEAIVFRPDGGAVARPAGKGPSASATWTAIVAGAGHQAPNGARPPTFSPDGRDHGRMWEL